MIPSHRKGKRPIRWTIAEVAEKWLPPSLLDAPEEFLQKNPPHKIVKESLIRAALIISGPKGDLFLKRYKIRGLREGLKYFVAPSKAQTEWVMTRLVLRRGIPTPLPLAIGERRERGYLKEAFLISQAISPSLPLIELIHEGGQEGYIFNAARLIRRIHEAGIFHKDLHAGNILVQREEGELYLIDLHRSQTLRRISERRRVWNLAQFLYSVKGSLSAEDREAFLRLYDEDGETFKGGIKKAQIKIERSQDRIHRRHMKSRTKRCLKNSGSFYVAKEGGWRIWSRREWETGELLEVIEKHKGIVADRKEGLIKDDRRTALTLFQSTDSRICIKEYRCKDFGKKLKRLLRGSKARRGWVNGNGLFVRGIKEIKPLALLDRRRWDFLPEAFLIMDTPSGYIELRSYIRENFEHPDSKMAKKGAFLKGLGAFMAKLYNLQIAHRDLKISNILVKEYDDYWCFGLTDWEDLKLDKEISEKKLIRGLVQMNTSTPLFINLRDRVRFLKEYLALIGRNDIRGVYREVIRGSEKRGWANLS
ncbi:MAG: hypothetical protein JSW32_05465 [Deltaproteobacteria bacterium]|nr:MAG: hypothetical protein JSW32_05465 [Deltaproteobacteria bacterium]